MALFVASEVITDPDQLSATVKLTTETRSAGDEVFIDTTPAGTLGNERTIELVVDAGNNLLKDSGVTLKALYSFLKDRWKADANLIKFPFPMTPITDEQFEFTNGWKLEDTNTSGLGNDGAGVTTPYLIRTGGWAVNQGPGTNDSERWANVISLGALDANDQVYYRSVNDTTSAPVDFFLEGSVNQAVQFYTDTNADGSADTDTSGFLEIFVRTFGKTYAQTNLDDIGAGDGITYQAYRFPLVNAQDVKIASSKAAALGTAIAIDTLVGSAGTVTVTTEANHGLATNDRMTIANATDTGFNTGVDGAVITVTGATTFTYVNATTGTENTSPATATGTYYDNMSISWAASGDTTSLSGFNDTFGTSGLSGSIPEAYFTVNIDANVASTSYTNAASAEIIYTWVQAQLNGTADINTNTGNTGIRRGDITPLKLQFIGDTLYTLGQDDVPGAEDYEGVRITDYATADQNRLVFWGYGSEENAAVTPTAIARSSNVVTVTVANSFTTGDYITIAGVTGGATDFNGTFELTGATGTNFTFAQTGGDESGTVSGTTTAAPAKFTNLTFPFQSTVTLNFNPNLATDTDTVYRVFFLNDDAGDNAGNDFGTNGAITVQDTSNTPVTGTNPGTSVNFAYAYDANVQRGSASAASDAPIVVVALGLEKAQYVKVDDQVIQRADLNISLVAPLERNYAPGSV